MGGDLAAAGAAARAGGDRSVEDRLRRVEDELEIVRLVSAYGPAVDCGDGWRAASLWTEDGVYDTDAGVWHGRGAIAAMVAGEGHHGLLAEGVAHVLGVPHIQLEGDRAAATCYSRVFRRTADGFTPWRVAANRWELVRTEEGWRAARRTTRMIDGSAPARELLARAPER